MKVFITGIAGFIGSNLADYLLARGYTVSGLDSLQWGVREQVPNGAGFYKADIRDELSVQQILWLEKPDAVFHFAAKNCIPDCQADPVEAFSINVLGTLSVARAAAMVRARLVYAETSAVYEGIRSMPTPEDAVAPSSYYALSKAAGRMAALAHCPDCTTLRYFCVYGPRQDYRRTTPPVCSAFIASLLLGRAPTIYGTGQKRRDFVHIDDVNRFHELCLTNPRTQGGVFNIGSGVNYSVCEVLDVARAVTGRHDVAPTYADDRPEEALTTLADCARARALGWAPQIPFEEGMRTMVSYIQREIEAGHLT